MHQQTGMKGCDAGCNFSDSHRRKTDGDSSVILPGQPCLAALRWPGAGSVNRRRGLKPKPWRSSPSATRCSPSRSPCRNRRRPKAAAIPENSRSTKLSGKFPAPIPPAGNLRLADWSTNRWFCAGRIFSNCRAGCK